MPHITYGLLLFGAFVLIFGIAIAVDALVDKDRKEEPPFRNYFGAEYDRDMLQHSSASESEAWQADLDSRFTPFRLRDRRTGERRGSDADAA